MMIPLVISMEALLIPKFERLGAFCGCFIRSSLSAVVRCYGKKNE